MVCRDNGGVTIQTEASIVSAFVLQKRALRDHPDEPPPEFDHDGIEDGLIEKPGRVIYHRDDEWAEF